MGEERYLAALYKKVKLFDGIYIYKFKEVVENVEYRADSDTIVYNKNGKRIEVYNMEDLDFTASDAKECFSDVMPYCYFMETYNIEEKDVKEKFMEELGSFIRFGIFDIEKEYLKIVDADVETLKKAKPDSHIFNFALGMEVGNIKDVIIPVSNVENIVELLEKRKKQQALELLRNVLTTAEETADVIGMQVEHKEETQEETDTSEDKLNNMVGMESIKLQIEKLKQYLVFMKNTESDLSLEFPNLNMVFFGNPGTGKTSVARILGKMFYELGFVKENKVTELTAQSFIAEYVGQTAVKTHKVINENRGGVIFIDEAYVFCSEGQTFGNEAIVEILKEMEKRDTIFIFAGYKEEMKDFITMNPGLKSRVGNYFDFPDYSSKELYEIFKRKAISSGFILEDEVEDYIINIVDKYKSKEHFGNGRFIMKLFDKIIVNHASNCYNIEDKDRLKLITKEDLPNEIDDELKLFEKTKNIGF